jgi:DNA-binding NtrC family response regulator
VVLVVEQQADRLDPEGGAGHDVRGYAVGELRDLEVRRGERLEDIEALSERILDDLPREEGLGAWILTDAAIRRLREHDWPGNVRELGNVLERATIEADREVIDLETISRALASGRPLTAEEPCETAAAASLSSILRAAEHNALLTALEKCGGDKEAAAVMLGISRSSFYSKLKAIEAAE